MKNTKNPKIKYSKIREHKTNMSELLLRRIINLLMSGEFDIVVTGKTGGEAGFIDYENNLIYLNPKEFPIEETLIHEVLHILKPELDEKTIIEISSLIYERLNNNQREKLIAYIKALATHCIGFKMKDLKPTYSL